MAPVSTSRPGHRHRCWFDAAPGAVLLWACTNEMLVRQGFGLSRLRGGAASAIATSCDKDNEIFVGNLDFRLTATDVDVAFSQFGTVTRVRLPSGDVAGENRGFAFVHYQDSRSCILACHNMDGSMFCGRSLRVSMARKHGALQPSPDGSAKSSMR